MSRPVTTQLAQHVPPPQARPFFGRVESLRGLGAMAVAGYHFTGATLNGRPLIPEPRWAEIYTLQDRLAWIAQALLPAHAALMMFFVMSGFVLRLSLEYGPRTASAAATKFLIGRVFRVYPIVFFAVVLIALLASTPFAVARDTNSPLTSRTFIANLFLVDVSMNSVLWALKLEMLMAPIILLLYFLDRKFGPRFLLFLALTTTGLAFAPAWAGWKPLSINLFSFVLGMLIPSFGHSFARDLSKRAAMRWAIGSVLLLVLPRPLLGVYSRFSTVIEAYAAFFFISLVAYRTDLSLFRWLDIRILRRLGLASGSYYVLHMLTPPLAIMIASMFVPMSWSTSAPVLVGCMVIAIWLVAITPLMMLTCSLIELPGIALGRRVIRACRLDAKRDIPSLQSEGHRMAA